MQVKDLLESYQTKSENLNSNLLNIFKKENQLVAGKIIKDDFQKFCDEYKKNSDFTDLKHIRHTTNVH